MRRVFSEDFTVSKRQLGAALMVLGTALLLAATVLTAAQGVRLAAIIGAFAGGAGVLVGLTLLPLGDRPA
ncbi:MAG: hypothetical protein AB1435_11530 [Chloroflexota bacterium]